MRKYGMVQYTMNLMGRQVNTSPAVGLTFPYIRLEQLTEDNRHFNCQMKIRMTASGIFKDIVSIDIKLTTADLLLMGANTGTEVQITVVVLKTKY
ncbi:hypothetical protein HOLleu_11381 [Holothuria leucospilota]|uniref:Uncharacterized protein n=1 Tax=Holothuria leucospilota TaxID=206669 RepID=A0A9Q1CEU6_HOLLE|nr:hypothetical protein HOLleu_11381 [Holothuria leucospilota]